jgi:hypothetical protein
MREMEGGRELPRTHPPKIDRFTGDEECLIEPGNRRSEK